MALQDNLETYYALASRYGLDLEWMHRGTKIQILGALSTCLFNWQQSRTDWTLADEIFSGRYPDFDENRDLANAVSQLSTKTDAQLAVFMAGLAAQIAESFEGQALIQSQLEEAQIPSGLALAAAEILSSPGKPDTQEQAMLDAAWAIASETAPHLAELFEPFWEVAA